MNDFVLPVTRYAQSGDVSIAYQTMGEGPIDLIIVPGMVSHVEFMHEGPGYTAILRRLSQFARVVTFDKRGQGLSDRVSNAPSLEQRMDDVRAIMDDIGSQRAALLGISEGSAMSILFAATYPERVSQLILYSGFANSPAARVNNYGQVVSERAKYWGSGKLIHLINPSRSNDPDAVSHFAKFERLSASPGAYKSFALLNAAIDVRQILPAVRVPTLVLHRRTDAFIPVEIGRELGAQIPGARYIEYPEGDHILTAADDVETLLGDIEEFSPDIATAPPPTSSACWPRCCSPISWIRPAAPQPRVTRNGGSCWTATISLQSRRSKSTAARWSKAPATAFSRPSTAPAAPSAARWPSGPHRNRSACRCARVCTPAKSKSGAAISAASPCMPRRV
jgi:pimeloyl-ACP methyl ester carboxylesterase